MRKVPSTHSIQSTKSTDLKTSTKVSPNDKTSSSPAKQGDETKKPADNSDHTTVSTSFCGCKKDKCDAFFDKLLCYLEKQSDVIAKCCAHSREHRRESRETLTQETKRSKDSRKEDTIDNARHPSPCKDDPAPNARHPSPCKDDPAPSPFRRASAETQRSLKGRSKDKPKDCPEDDSDSKPSKYKSQLKVGDKPCKIYVEVCSCQKEGKRAPSNRSFQKTIEDDCDDSVKQAATPLQRHPSGKSNEYNIDCCENKVTYFFKLAEEICQGYMKQCKEQDPKRARSNHSGQRRNSREDVGNQFPSRPYQSQPWKEDYMRPEKLSTNEHDAYDRPKAKPIAIEIDCLGTKEQILVEPCTCVERCPDGGSGRGRPTPAPSRVESQCPKKCCLEVFEDKYGKMLRDLHDKFIPDPRQNTPPAGYVPQGNQQPGYLNPDGDAPPVRPQASPPPPPVWPQPSPPPPPTPPQQPSPPTISKQLDDDDSSDDRKKPKKKDKKNKKSKASKDS